MESLSTEKNFDLKRKHIFILSSAGKPIFSRHGDEQELVTTFGLLQAVISIVQDSGDTLKCIRSKNRTIVYFLRNSLYFVMISSSLEPEAILNLQLEFMYSLILVILTSRVHDILDNNSSKDLRDLLGPETTRLLHASCTNDITSPSIAFQCVKPFAIMNDFREEINSMLTGCVEDSSSALGMLLYEDSLISYASNSLVLNTQDVVLLCHFVCNATSLRSHDQNWVPICLPNFNSKAYLQAYVCNLKVKDSMDKSVDMFLILVAANSESSAFKDLHESRLLLEKDLNKSPISNRLIYTFEQQKFSIPRLFPQSIFLHFFFKFRPPSKENSHQYPAQGISSNFDISLQSDDSQERIWIVYQKLALFMRSGSYIAEDTLPSAISKSSNKSSSSSSSSSSASPTKNDDYEDHIMTTIPVPDHALNYVVLSTGIVIVSLASSDSELFVTFPSTVTALEACGLAKNLSSTLKSESSHLFLI